jgi:flagellar biosynthesis GTPase FlhF
MKRIISCAPQKRSESLDDCHVSRSGTEIKINGVVFRVDKVYGLKSGLGGVSPDVLEKQIERGVVAQLALMRVSDYRRFACYELRGGIYEPPYDLGVFDNKKYEVVNLEKLRKFSEWKKRQREQMKAARSSAADAHQQLRPNGDNTMPETKKQQAAETKKQQAAETKKQQAETKKQRAETKKQRAETKKQQTVKTKKQQTAEANASYKWLLQRLKSQIKAQFQDDGDRKQARTVLTPLESFSEVKAEAIKSLGFTEETFEAFLDAFFDASTN